MNFFDGAVKLTDGQMIFEEGKLENARVAGGAAAGGNGDAARSDEPVGFLQTGRLLKGSLARRVIPGGDRGRSPNGAGHPIEAGVLIPPRICRFRARA